MYAEATKAALRLYKRYNARGGEPPRIVVEVSREARQVAEAYRSVLEAQGATAQADEFFAQMEARLQAGAVNLSPGAGPRPYLEPEKSLGPSSG